MNNSAQPVLVVEDETLIRLDLVDLLESEGYIVTSAADADAAMMQITGTPELAALVTDINLGSDATGWDLARYARTRFPEVAVVYVTADSFSDWETDGVADSLILQKPFSDQEVLSSVRTALG